MAFSQRYMEEYERKMKHWFAKELERNTVQTLVVACKRLRPDLDPNAFVKEMIEEGKKQMDEERSKIITPERPGIQLVKSI